MGNAAGVFQVGEAHVFFPALVRGHARKLGWRFVVGATEWPLLVVFCLPIAYLPACVEEIGKPPANPQARLVVQSTVEALNMSVLRRPGLPEFAIKGRGTGSRGSAGLGTDYLKHQDRLRTVWMSLWVTKRF